MSEQKLDFESALKRLEEITNRLEKSETPLEEALKLFEEGTALARTLTVQLDEATQKVTMLTSAMNGSSEERDFQPTQG